MVASRVQGVRSRGQLEFEAAVRPLMPRLYRFCLALCRNKAEAEDLLQEGLWRAYRNEDSFRGTGELFGWLCGILRNQFIEQRRSEARRRGLLDGVLQGASEVLGAIFSGGTERTAPDEQACQTEQAALLLRCLKTLPEHFRTVVLLCDIEELSYTEAAAILGIPIGTVKSRHSRGRAQLAVALEKQKVGGSPG